MWLKQNGESLMSKMKPLIALGGAMLIAISMMNPGMAGIALFLTGLSTLMAVIIVPLVAMVANPITNWCLNTSIGQKLGDRGQYWVRVLFTVPIPKRSLMKRGE